MNNKNRIIEVLRENISSSNKNKSSHWKAHLDKDSNYDDPYSSLGFGSFTKKTYLKSFFHFIMSRLIFEKKIFSTNTFHKYKNIFDTINRQVDVDTIRHIYTFELLKKKINPLKICIIGDGKLNGLIGSLITFKDVKVYTVNLSETLINDYLILKKTNLVLENQIHVINSRNKNIDENYKIVFIPSNYKDVLFKNNIDLFINIASFQEMTNNEIKKYFEIFKSNNSYLFTCNREYKKLYGGEELIFDNYPWNNGNKIIYDYCSWHQKFYMTKFPFIKKYDGKVKHCLINFSK